jgi:hypothetical protein
MTYEMHIYQSINLKKLLLGKKIIDVRWELVLAMILHTIHYSVKVVLLANGNRYAVDLDAVIFFPLVVRFSKL